MKRAISLLTFVMLFPLVSPAQNQNLQNATIRILTPQEMASAGVQLCATPATHRHWFVRAPVKLTNLLRHLTKKIAA